MIKTICHLPGGCVQIRTTLKELTENVFGFWSVLTPNESEHVPMDNLRRILDRLGAADFIINNLSSLISAQELHGSAGVSFEGLIALFHSNHLAAVRLNFEGLRTLFRKLFDSGDRGYTLATEMEAWFGRMAGPGWTQSAECAQVRETLGLFGLCAGDPVVIGFKDFLRMLELNGLEPELEAKLWHLPTVPEPRFSEEDVVEIRYLVLQHPPEERSDVRAGEMFSVLCEQQRMALQVYFKGLSPDGIKMLYKSHMHLVHMEAGSNVVQAKENAHMVYFIMKGSVLVKVAPGDKEPVSTWAQLRSILLNTLRDFDLCADRGAQLHEIWKREQTRTGQADGQEAVSAGAGAVLKAGSFKKLKPPAKRVRVEVWGGPALKKKTYL
eukprot:TRINITY_DN17071_c0_g2_i6.p1 TRINITY_DN17071_c0_g2~~TRINITY_DN17071_c0_g2_i6.p1  ORF type:complete len:382 (-),score=69.07 TRINITY_DN17071_c0_g2_i6:58-1203(-)